MSPDILTVLIIGPVAVITVAAYVIECVADWSISRAEVAPEIIGRFTPGPPGPCGLLPRPVHPPVPGVRPPGRAA